MRFKMTFVSIAFAVQKSFPEMNNRRSFRRKYLYKLLKKIGVRNMGFMTGEEFSSGVDFACKLDQDDYLSSYRQEFYHPRDTIYLDGNSLGLFSHRAEKKLLQALKEWQELAIAGWTKAEPPWFWYGEKLGELTAPLLGAKTRETIVTGSTTLNIHQLIATLYQPETIGHEILIDELNFPSDHYAVKSELKLLGGDPDKDLIVVKSVDGVTIAEEDIIEKFSQKVGLALLPSVQYQSGQLLDIERLTEAAHRHNIIIGFDLAHSIGAVPHQLSDLGVDFAVWCNYKYLNAGPGAVGGLYLNNKHLGREPALAGWWGHDKSTQFEMKKDFRSADTAGALQIGTIPVLSSAPLFGSLEMINEIGIEKVRERSLKLTGYLLYLIEKRLSGLKIDFSVNTPLEPERRGGHIALRPHREAYKINEALKDRGIIGDFREPDTIRLAPSPLYTSFQDIWKSVDELREIVINDKYQEFSSSRSEVT